MKKFILIIALLLTVTIAHAQTFSLPENLSSYDVADWVLHSGFIASGTYDPTSVASNSQLYLNVATPTAPILWASWDGSWQKITSSFASGTVTHAALLDLDYDASGHTGFAATADIPNNASFTLNALGEKEWSSLDGAPTNASYTLLLLSEHSFNSLTDKPTSADYTLAGLGEHSFDSLTDKPTSADYTLLGLSEKLWSSLDGAPTNASYTLALLSEHSYNSLTDKPTSGSWSLNALGEKNFSSLANKPTTLSGYGITDGVDAVGLSNHIAETVNPHGEIMTMGTGTGTGGFGYLSDDTVFAKDYFYIPMKAAATTTGVTAYGMTFWADTATNFLKFYNGLAWVKVVSQDSSGRALIDVMHLAPSGTAPASPTLGDIYCNTNGHAYLYNGSAWVQLDN